MTTLFWRKCLTAALSGGILLGGVGVALRASPAAAASCSVTKGVSNPSHYTLGGNTVGWFAGLTVSGDCGFVYADTWLERYRCYTRLYCLWQPVGNNTQAFKGHGGNTWQYAEKGWAGSGRYRAVVGGPGNSVRSPEVRL